MKTLRALLATALLTFSLAVTVGISHHASAGAVGVRGGGDTSSVITGDGAVGTRG